MPADLKDAAKRRRVGQIFAELRVSPLNRWRLHKHVEGRCLEKSSKDRKW